MRLRRVLAVDEISTTRHCGCSRPVPVARLGMRTLGGDMNDERPTEFQMLLAITALTPEHEGGPRLPLQVALARLGRIAREAQQDEVQEIVEA